MPTLVPNIQISLADIDAHGVDGALRRVAAGRLGVAVADIAELTPRRRSLDARKGRPLRFVYTVDARLANEPVPGDEPPPAPDALPALSHAALVGPPVVVVGAGPAGLFAALRLTDRGVPCVLLERGQPVAERHRDVHRLRQHGALDPESNVCFGEGGAGTYSDGKLFTRKKDRGIRAVLAELVAHGAHPDIAVDAHPHIGSNRLARIVPRIRQTLLDRGAVVRFGARVVGLETRDGRVVGVRLADGERLDARAVVLATGHAARDTYQALLDDGVAVELKGFAVGFRLEHPQPLIDRIQYGRAAGHPALPVAEYRLARTVRDRGVYSFCMCPGGYVVPTPVEEDGLSVNGMSNHKRGAPLANSAIVVEVREDEIERLAGVEGSMAGIALQRALERESFRRGGGGFRAPAQRLTDFLAGRVGDAPATTSYRPGITPTTLNGLLPPSLEDALVAGLRGFGRSLRGFETEDATLIAVESLTSAPLRIVRDRTTLESPSHAGLYPAGEGAGHAGGITSSALDGAKVAAAIIARLA